MKKLKNVGMYAFKVLIALFFLGYMLFIYLVLFIPNLINDSTIVNRLSIIAILLSLFGIVDQIEDSINNRKKSYNLICECPNCKTVIEMEMKEN